MTVSDAKDNEWQSIIFKVFLHFKNKTMVEPIEGLNGQNNDSIFLLFFLKRRELLVFDTTYNRHMTSCIAK